MKERENQFFDFWKYTNNFFVIICLVGGKKLNLHCTMAKKVEKIKRDSKTFSHFLNRFFFLALDLYT
jgi:hypothetical protein